MPIAAGRGIGGGSLVNSALCFRAPAPVLDNWTAVLGGEDRFSRANLDPIYAEMEALLGVGVSSEAISGENNRIVARGAAALGYPGGLAPRNAPQCIGCSLCNSGCPSGGKASVDRNLITEARAAGAIVQAEIKVDRILVEAGAAVGVEGYAIDPDTRKVMGRLTVRANHVVCSAGAVGTPRLFAVSGIAETLGPAVGKGLHVHPGGAVLGLCDHEVAMWKGATQGAYFEIPGEPGLLPHTFNAPPGAVLVMLGETGREAKASFEWLSRLCGALVMVSDHGEGTVGATADGRADIRYDFDLHDVERIKLGMVETARVLMAGGAKKVKPLVHGGSWFDDIEAFKKALDPKGLDAFTLYASHPMATCRMGLDPATSVIDVNGAAHKVKRLTIADASVFPTSLGVNPQLTTMTVATRIARGIR